MATIKKEPKKKKIIKPKKITKPKIKEVDVRVNYLYYTPNVITIPNRILAAIDILIKGKSKHISHEINMHVEHYDEKAKKWKDIYTIRNG